MLTNICSVCIIAVIKNKCSQEEGILMNNTQKLQIKSNKSKRKKRIVHFKKLMLGILTLGLIITLSILFSNRLVSAHDNIHENQSNKPKYYKSIQIQSGDTLWRIAEQHMSREYDSITDYIIEVKRINNLASDDIQANQYLTIPYYL